MEDRKSANTLISDFPGLLTNTDNWKGGQAQVQSNVTSVVPGRLRGRDGLKPVAWGSGYTGTMVSQIDTVTLSVTPRSGSFTLTLGSFTTSAIDANATDVEIEAAIAAVLGSGAVFVTISGSDVLLHYTGGLAYATQAQVTCDSSLLLKQSADGAINANSRTLAQLQWDFSADTGNPVTGTASVSGYGDVVLSLTPTGNDASDLASLEGSTDSSIVTILGLTSGVVSYAIIGAAAGRHIVSTSSTGSQTPAILVDGAPASLSIYAVASSGGATAGTFTLTGSGGTTTGLAFNAASSAIATAVATITGLTSLTSSGTGTESDPWIISAQPTVISIDSVTGDWSGLRILYGPVTCGTSQAASAGSAPIRSVDFSKPWNDIVVYQTEDGTVKYAKDPS